MIDKPFSPACERNREPILAVLREHFAGCRQVLEIGSGTGQHAVHFAAAMPWLQWQCSDRADCLPGIQQWLDEAALANTPAAIELDVADAAWPSPAQPPTPTLPRTQGREASGFDAARSSALSPLPLAGDGWGEGVSGFDAIFSANTLHIMGWTEVQAFFAVVGEVLADAATVVIYGPFNDAGAYSSDSNRDFDAWLKARDARSGIRDFEAVDGLARALGLRLVADVAMPANNRCLVWRREACSPA